MKPLFYNPKLFWKEQSVWEAEAGPVGSYLCELVALLCRALCLAGGIAECKDDWSLVESCHVCDDLLCERSSNCSHSCRTESSLSSLKDQNCELALMLFWNVMQMLRLHTQYLMLTNSLCTTFLYFTSLILTTIFL